MKTRGSEYRILYSFYEQLNIIITDSTINEYRPTLSITGLIVSAPDYDVQYTDSGFIPRFHSF